MDEPDLATADPREQIGRLEERIEALSEKLENCRKFAAAARFAIALGAALMLALLFGVMAFDPLAFTAAIAALLGGVVVLGSNRSTANEASAELAEAEAARAALIGRIDLRVIEGGRTLH
jgi:hypothetical protein